MGNLRIGLSVVCTVLTLSPVPCAAGGPKAVTELFTAEGCADCLAADENLNKLSQDPNILTLTFPITYFDEEGWTDHNAQPAFTDRQVAYDARLGPLVPGAPQIIINGRATSTGTNSAELSALIDHNILKPPCTATIEGSRVTVGKGTAPFEGADIWLVGYSPNIENIVVGGGRNIGRTIGNAGLVRSLALLGRWSGETLSFEVPEAGSWKQAILIQTGNGGPILAATTLQDQPARLTAAFH
ncbi:hypothetical protein EV561_115103 [Rhizobium sp. BK376]|nr:hypothetical protein EV561_115103 [Rhizobium sp. BK376]